jgi:hypothetical protein
MTFNVKLSSLPLLIWASLRKIEIQFKFGTIFFIAGFLIIPICVVNFITSGYPLYPSTLIQINSDWTLSLNAVQQIKNDIFRYAAFTPNYWLEPDYATTPIIKKIYLWSTSKYEFITFSLIIGSIASFLYLRKITPSQNQKNISMISLLSLIGIVFFIATAPTIRFGIQWLIILPSLSIAYIIHTYRYSAKKIHLFTSCVTPFLALIFLVSPVANTQKLIYSAIDKKTIQFDGNSSLNFLTPPPLPNVVTEDDSINKVAYRIRPLIYETNKEGINIAQGPQCWNTPIPCATMMNFQIFTPKRWHKSGYKQKEQAD